MANVSVRRPMRRSVRVRRGRGDSSGGSGGRSDRGRESYLRAPGADTNRIGSPAAGVVDDRDGRERDRRLDPRHRGGSTTVAGTGAGAMPGAAMAARRVLGEPGGVPVSVRGPRLFVPGGGAAPMRESVQRTGVQPVRVDCREDEPEGERRRQQAAGPQSTHGVNIPARSPPPIVDGQLLPNGHRLPGRPPSTGHGFFG
jgi:hypothetical protein